MKPLNRVRHIFVGKVLEDDGQVRPAIPEKSHITLLRKHTFAELRSAHQISASGILSGRPISAQRGHVFQVGNDKTIGMTLQKLLTNQIHHRQQIAGNIIVRIEDETAGTGWENGQERIDLVQTPTILFT
jgi:hypothetical protein